MCTYVYLWVYCRYDRFSLRLLELTKNSGGNGSRLLLEGVSIKCWLLPENWMALEANLFNLIIIVSCNSTITKACMWSMAAYVGFTNRFSISYKDVHWNDGQNQTSISQYLYYQPPSRLCLVNGFQWERKTHVNLILTVKNLGNWLKHAVRNLEKVNLITMYPCECVMKSSWIDLVICNNSLL